MATHGTDIFGMVKTLIDAHTMGIRAATALLEDCDYKVFIAPKKVEDALDKLSSETYQEILVEWIKENHINHLGVSYRLDPDDAVAIVERLVYTLVKKGLYNCSGAQVRDMHFAGLKPACEKIDKEFNGKIRTFRGGESAEETLRVMGIPEDEIPKHITEGCKYDKDLLKFGKDLIRSEEYKGEKPLERNPYLEFGTFQDSVMKRLDANFKGGFAPLIRAHSGPYSPDLTRPQCLMQYRDWCKTLASAGYLDILSIGSSQLSQSNFGEDWTGKLNGGGVPVNSEQEYLDVWLSARPMLVRTYSGTKDVKPMAEMYERTINNAWNALSIWWFDELDGRGPNNLYENLKEHIQTIKYVANINKPFEANVPHHFAFRGCDDVTYIVSAYLAAKMAKKCGIKTYIQQNMLNTPRSTWGVQDLAKSRTMLNLVKSLEDENFSVILQTRAGLDYFKPDRDEAKAQLAAVSAMMDDIDPDNVKSPQIIHVVSYSEALFLATPDILNESIQITRTALREYRDLKKKGLTPDVRTDDILKRTQLLEGAARRIIQEMEKNIFNLYSPEGLYISFVAGWLPTPELWSNSDEFKYAKDWDTRMSNGGISVFQGPVLMTLDSRINKCIKHIPDAEYILKSKYLKSSLIPAQNVDKNVLDALVKKKVLKTENK